MTCKDCLQHPATISQPTAESGPRPNGPGWVVYSGGSHENHLAMMRFTLPPGYGRVTFHDDGSIEYQRGPDDWEPPRPIDGYVLDGENSWLFRPVWTPCALRMHSTVLHESCQCIDVIAFCMRSQKMVTSEKCDSCEQRVPVE